MFPKDTVETVTTRKNKVTKPGLFSNQINRAVIQSNVVAIGSDRVATRVFLTGVVVMTSGYILQRWR